MKHLFYEPCGRVAKCSSYYLLLRFQFEREGKDD